MDIDSAFAVASRPVGCCRRLRPDDEEAVANLFRIAGDGISLFGQQQDVSLSAKIWIGLPESIDSALFESSVAPSWSSSCRLHCRRPVST
jgi:hypothetical protein